MSRTTRSTKVSKVKLLSWKWRILLAFVYLGLGYYVLRVAFDTGSLIAYGVFIALVIAVLRLLRPRLNKK